MTCCGIATGLIWNVFGMFISRFVLKDVSKDKMSRRQSVLSAVAKLLCCVVTAVMIGEFLFFCRNGKLSFVGGAAFIAGLWLWKKCCYDTIKR